MRLKPDGRLIIITLYLGRKSKSTKATKLQDITLRERGEFGDEELPKIHFQFPLGKKDCISLFFFLIPHMQVSIVIMWFCLAYFLFLVYIKYSHNFLHNCKSS